MNHLVLAFKLFLPSIATGILFVLSNPPFDLWYLAFVAFVPLLYVSINLGYGKVLLSYVSVAIIVSTGWWYSVAAYSLMTFILITTVMCISFAVWGLCWKALYNHFRWPVVFIFVSTLLWIGIERIHTSEWVGVPGNLGITQYAQPLLIQAASIFGIYAVSFLVLLANSVVAYAILMIRKQVPATASALVVIFLAALVHIANFTYGYSVINQKYHREDNVKIAVVQPVIASHVYRNSWRNPENRKFMKVTFDDLTARAVEADVEIVFWPEGSNGYFNMRIPELRENLYNIARNNNVAFLISSDDLDSQGNKFNSIFSISRQGAYLDRYDKVNLIGGAEDAYTPGNSHVPVSSSYGNVAAAICYETNFPEIFRTMTAQGAGLLFASTSDAAFKRTALVLSHTNLSVFRAVENRKWMVHASNTGPSIIVSARGEVVSSLPLYKRGIMVSNVGLVPGKSIFVRYGYLVPMVLAFFAIIVAMLLGYWVIGYKIKEFRSLKVSVFSYSIRFLALKSKVMGKALSYSLVFHVFIAAVIVSISINRVNVLIDDGTGFRTALNDYIYNREDQADVVSEKFIQASSNTCGPAVMAYLVSYYGKELLEDDLVPLMSVSETGTSMLELKRVAAQLGFDAKGVKANMSALKQLALPIIAYINDSHYVVINKISKGYVYLFDPLGGHVKITENSFRDMWKGYLLSVRTREIPLKSDSEKLSQLQ